MKELRRLETATTEYLVPTTISLVLLTVGGFALILNLGLVELDPLTKFVDATFKTAAVLVGGTWALNRYFVTRTDAPQLRVDPILEVIPPATLGQTDVGVLLYRLDILNTGRTLIPIFQQFVEIEAIRMSDAGVFYERLARWPSEGWHPGGPIEPGSWSAINDAHCLPADVKAVRLFLEVQMRSGTRWTWHRSFTLSGKASDE